MDCSEIKNLINNHIEIKDKETLDHIVSCQNCSKYYSSSLKIETLFSKYSFMLDDEKGDDFDDALFIKLQKNVPPKQNFTTNTKSYVFRAFAVLFFVFMFVFGTVIYFIYNRQSSDILVSSTDTELFKPVRIILEYESDSDISGVEVFFNLDKGVKFYSDNEKISELETYIWKGNLKKGSNRIPFVVSVIEDGSWNIMTEARYMGMVHRHKISFKTNEEKIAVNVYKLETVPSSI